MKSGHAGHALRIVDWPPSGGWATGLWKERPALWVTDDNSKAPCGMGLVAQLTLCWFQALNEQSW